MESKLLHEGDAGARSTRSSAGAAWADIDARLISGSGC